MSTDIIRLTVTDMVAGQPCVVSMQYPCVCWDDVTEFDREQLRLVARHRYGSWVRDEFGIRLDDAYLNALPVTAA